MRTDTALNVINDALLELGLASDEADAVYTSEDANVILLRNHLKALGRELVRIRPWSHLQKTHTFSTVNGTESYALPTDLIHMLHSTEWNRTTDQRLSGPLGAQGWQYLKAVDTAGTVSYFFRVYGNKLYLHPTPMASETVAFEYVSAYWVQPSGQTTPTADKPTADTDTLWFDGHLLSRGLKVRWLESKGFDSAVARNEYDAALAVAMGNDGAAPVLDLAPQRGISVRLLTPETGWGS